MRLEGLGTNFASFLDIKAFSPLLNDLDLGDSPLKALASDLEETFHCIAQTLDGSTESKGFSILGKLSHSNIERGTTELKFSTRID